MNKWDPLIRAIVPLTFVLIWALTALFNRESKGFPARAPGSSPPTGPKPGEPPMRWAPSGSSPPAGVRRVPIGDNDILIIQNDPARPPRQGQARPNQGGPRRPSKAKAAPLPAKKEEPIAARPKLGGVTQNVNQQLARPIDLAPLTTIAPMATATGTDLARAPSAPARTSAVVTASTLTTLMADPIRLREAFIVNELLRPPLALRGKGGPRR